MPEKIYTVTEITREIKGLLEESFPALWIEGEISNYVLHSSGHRYFSLKDENAQLRCTLWRFRGERLRFEPEDGVQVIASGSISVYERTGQYQLDVMELIPAGLGKLEIAFQKLKEKLWKEGLFDEEHKKPIPEFPEAIGLVTSPTGAAIRDMIEIIQKRFPSVRMIVNPTRVQGKGAAEEIATAIGDFNRFAKIDVMIVGRGGGSLEDLWAFNEEVVARAIYDSKIPTISAVGHQVDFTISDFVSDLRAPTPSAAAQMVVRDKQEILKELRSSTEKLTYYQSSLIEYSKQRLKAARQSYGLRRPSDLVRQTSQRVDDLTRFLLEKIKNYFEFQKSNLSLNDEKLSAMSPLSVLKRGYSIARKLPRLKIVKDAGLLRKGDRLEVKFFKGKVTSNVEQVDSG